MNVTVAGAGYVGLSVAANLARIESVLVVDIVAEKVEKINARVAPIKDAGLESWFAEHELDLRATTDSWSAYKEAELVIVAVPTNYDDARGKFDTSQVDKVVAATLDVNPDALVVIKSTVPIGYTDTLKERYPQGRFLFSPEFLREGHALEDNVHPSRIVVGVPAVSLDDEKACEDARMVAALLADAALDDGVAQFIMGAAEAEAVKLFANTYLAMRVAYFNELDSYAIKNGMDASRVIEAVCADPRIGNHYNNPSFGYGGYCLPKDSKQLLANFVGIPQDVVGAVVHANTTRKEAIVADILRVLDQLGIVGRDPVVGVHRLVMKQGADNLRASATVDIAERLKSVGTQVVVFEPLVDADEFHGIPVLADLKDFKATSDLIVCNRYDTGLDDVADKVYTRDIYGRD